MVERGAEGCSPSGPADGWIHRRNQGLLVEEGEIDLKGVLHMCDEMLMVVVVSEQFFKLSFAYLPSRRMYNLFGDQCSCFTAYRQVEDLPHSRNNVTTTHQLRASLPNPIPQ